MQPADNPAEIKEEPGSFPLGQRGHDFFRVLAWNEPDQKIIPAVEAIIPPAGADQFRRGNPSRGCNIQGGYEISYLAGSSFFSFGNL